MRFRSLTFPLAGAAFLALALSVACGSSSSSPTTPTPPAGGGGGGAADVSGSIASFKFSPDPLVVKVGQKVAWSNSDSVAHTATGDSGEFDTGAISPGSSSSPMTMSTAGTFTYHCQIHPNMKATLQVTQ